MSCCIPNSPDCMCYGYDKEIERIKQRERDRREKYKDKPGFQEFIAEMEEAMKPENVRRRQEEFNKHSEEEK